MNKRIIVRADHYPDGYIMPLGFTDSSGKTIYIDRVLDINIDNSRIMYRCISKEKEYNLFYSNCKWDLEE